MNVAKSVTVRLIKFKLNFDLAFIAANCEVNM